MSLPSWALFMKKCYADKTLKISEEDFAKPKNLATNINCDKKIIIEGEEGEELIKIMPKEDTDF
jgi:penicillin-binding protein 1A